MGWPGCMNCDNWPALGHSGLCNKCITNPELVVITADKMFENSYNATKSEFESHCLLAFLTREPNGILVKKVWEKLQDDPTLDVKQAITKVREEYWKNFYKDPNSQNR